MNRLLTGLVLLVFISQLPACKVGRKPTRKKLIVDTTAVARVQDSIRTVDSLNQEKQALIAKLTNLWESQIAFTTFNAKVKAHYQGPDQKQEFTANIRIEKDKAIWASVTALGMVNVARILITPDSFKMINYLEKKVTLIAIKDADTLLPMPVDFQYLQNMLLGNVLKQGGRITDANEFGGTWSLQSEDTVFIQQYTYNKSDTTMRSAQLSSKNDAGTGGMIQLGNYELQGGRKFSTGRAIHMMSDGQNHYLDMNFNKVDFDQPVDFPFSIPKKFDINGVADDSDRGAERKEQRKERKAIRKAK